VLQIEAEVDASRCGGSWSWTVEEATAWLPAREQMRRSKGVPMKMTTAPLHLCPARSSLSMGRWGLAGVGAGGERGEGWH
jgi:hypothetical protein